MIHHSADAGGHINIKGDEMNESGWLRIAACESIPLWGEFVSALV